MHAGTHTQHTHRHARTHRHTHTHMHAQTDTDTHTYMHAQTHTHTHARTDRHTDYQPLSDSTVHEKTKSPSKGYTNALTAVQCNLVIKDTSLMRTAYCPSYTTTSNLG